MKKQSGGKRAGKAGKQPKQVVLFLDENLDCPAVTNALTRAKIKFVQFSAKFPRGTPDTEWLPTVGQNKWVLVTADQKIRTRGLERAAVRQYKVREFAFTSGNLGGESVATLLVQNYRAICRFCAANSAPFIASITKSGDISLRVKP